MKKQAILPPGCPQVLGPYSPGLKMGRMIFFSGQIAQDKDGRMVAPGDVAGQTRQALKNLGELLSAAGITFEDVAMVNVYLKDIERDFEGMNREYQKFFCQPYPARVTVQSFMAEADCLVEISAMALDDKES